MPSDPPRQQHPVDRVPCLRGSPGPWTAHGVCRAHLAGAPHATSAWLTWPVDRARRLRGSPGLWTAHGVCGAHLARGPRTPSEQKPRTAAPAPRACGPLTGLPHVRPIAESRSLQQLPLTSKKVERKPPRLPAVTLNSSVLTARPAPPSRKEDEAGAGDPFTLGTKAPQ